MNPSDVTPGSSPAPIADAPVVPTPEPVTPTPAVPGAQTPSENLLAALQQEREEKRLLKEENERLRNAPPALSQDDVYSDEGKLILDKYVRPLSDTVTSLQEQLVLKDLMITHPELKDKMSEFDEFRKEYPRHKLENVAKLFLSEQGLLTGAEPRKGLESQSGGGQRTPASPSQTSDDIKALRETNPRKYTQLLKEGKIRI